MFTYLYQAYLDSDEFTKANIRGEIAVVLIVIVIILLLIFLTNMGVWSIFIIGLGSLLILNVINIGYNYWGTNKQDEIQAREFASSNA